MARRPHLLVVSNQAQGHNTPLLKLSHRIADHGMKVTFVNTESVNARMMAAMPDKEKEQSRIEVVSIPDSVQIGDSVQNLIDLIEKINGSKNEQISCIMATASLRWIQEVAKRMGIEYVAAWPGGPGNLALLLHIPKLIEAGYIDENGTPLKNELISLSNQIPAWSGNTFTWSFPGNPKIEKRNFRYALQANQTVQQAKWVVCNTYSELDSASCDLIPNILPIGPLLASDYPGHFTGSFWPEDSTCLTWLDKQPTNSVIYVAFGSVAIFSHHQFNELALGLELSGHPFLWVVRSDLHSNGLIPEFPDGFLERVADRGNIVQWAPQEKVLAHRSIACFFTHCGWNSTLEGLSMGVPFLCWPHFADQFHNESYICEIWKVGIKLNHEESGFMLRHEIKKKEEKLLSSIDIKANVLKQKEMARKGVGKGGSSSENFELFVEHLKL